MRLLTIDIARRYLFGKKSTNSINIITGISVFGISVGTAALILILSVFNGFESLLSGLFNAFNPDLIVVPIEGKFFHTDSTLMEAILDIPGVIAVSETLEEVAFFEYKGIQDFGHIKGVDQSYKEVTRLDSLVLDGVYGLKKDNIQYCMIGVGLRNKLSVNIDDRLTPITIYTFNSKNSLVSGKEFSKKAAYPTGVFSVKSDSDHQYAIVTLELAKSLISSKGGISALEIKVEDGDHKRLTQALKSILPTGLKVMDRYEQDETFLKVMRIEKWVSFMIAGLTMLLVAFNLLGALWMIGLDKRKDISILKSMGFTSHGVKWLFLTLGMMITVIGLLLGFAIALFLYYIQKEYGLIGVPASFMIDAYPVKLKLPDFLIVTLAVLVIGWLASILPANKAARSNSIQNNK